MSEHDAGGKTAIDLYYLKIAFEESKNSDDPKARTVAQSAVGAVLVANGKIIGRSANVLPPALKARHVLLKRPIQEMERYHIIEHAERSAIFKAFLVGSSTVGSTIYCTRFPCSDCARAIVWSGVTRAVFASGFAAEKRWIDAQRAALEIMRDAGVTVRVLSEVV